jgi:hypothetical protein
MIEKLGGRARGGRWCAGVFAVVIAGLFAAGCGSSSSSSSSSAAPPASSSSSGAPSTASAAAKAAATSTGSSGLPTGTSVGSLCKQYVSGSSELPATVKAQAEKICAQLSVGNTAGARALAAKTCVDTIEADVPAGPAKQAALAHCPKP